MEIRYKAGQTSTLCLLTDEEKYALTNAVKEYHTYLQLNRILTPHDADLIIEALYALNANGGGWTAIDNTIYSAALYYRNFIEDAPPCNYNEADYTPLIGILSEL